jgi:hypothetical protein
VASTPKFLRRFSVWMIRLVHSRNLMLAGPNHFVGGGEVIQDVQAKRWAGSRSTSRSPGPPPATRV